MAFSSLSELLGRKIKHLGLDKVLEGQRIKDIVDTYLSRNLKIPETQAFVKNYKNGTLTIMCQKSVISSGLKMREEELRDYLKQKLPKIKIKKIFYQLG